MADYRRARRHCRGLAVLLGRAARIPLDRPGGRRAVRRARHRGDAEHGHRTAGRHVRLGPAPHRDRARRVRAEPVRRSVRQHGQHRHGLVDRLLPPERRGCPALRPSCGGRLHRLPQRAVQHQGPAGQGPAACHTGDARDAAGQAGRTGQEAPPTDRRRAGPGAGPRRRCHPGPVRRPGPRPRGPGALPGRPGAGRDPAAGPRGGPGVRVLPRAALYRRRGLPLPAVPRPTAVRPRWRHGPARNRAAGLRGPHLRGGKPGPGAGPGRGVRHCRGRGPAAHLGESAAACAQVADRGLRLRGPGRPERAAGRRGVRGRGGAAGRDPRRDAGRARPRDAGRARPRDAGRARRRAAVRGRRRGRGRGRRPPGHGPPDRGPGGPAGRGRRGGRGQPAGADGLGRDVPGPRERHGADGGRRPAHRPRGSQRGRKGDPGRLPVLAGVLNNEPFSHRWPRIGPEREREWLAPWDAGPAGSASPPMPNGQNGQRPAQLGAASTRLYRPSDSGDDEPTTPFG